MTTSSAKMYRVIAEEAASMKQTLWLNDIVQLLSYARSPYFDFLHLLIVADSNACLAQFR